MCFYLRAKYEVSSLILTSFRQGERGVILSRKKPRTLKKFTQIRLKKNSLSFSRSSLSIISCCPLIMFAKNCLLLSFCSFRRSICCFWRVISCSWIFCHCFSFEDFCITFFSLLRLLKLKIYLQNLLIHDNYVKSVKVLPLLKWKFMKVCIFWYSLIFTSVYYYHTFWRML